MDYLGLLEKITAVVEPILNALGFELADREFVSEQGRWVLRLFIDRETSPVTVGDCQTVSRAVEGALDVEDLIPYRYVLEVSSPGIERPLRKKGDFERFKGNRIELKTKELVQGRRHFSGMLRGIEGENIVIVEENQQWCIPFGQLKKAKVKRRIEL